MATTAIWDVSGWLGNVINYANDPVKTENPEWSEGQKQAMLDVMEQAMAEARARGLKDVLEYAAADFKTEQQYYVAGLNCDPQDARLTMTATKKQWGKEDGIVAFHGYQSFKPGETTPELAHRIGVELAEKLWGDRFEVIVATHLNTKCYHNHFVLNSVSFKDGLRYYDNKKTYKLMRRESDELCRKYALSVITEFKGRGRHYAEWQADKDDRPTWRTAIRKDVDETAVGSTSFQAFLRGLKDKGYEIKMGKHIAIRPPGKERFVRLRSLGDAYEEEAIRQRILDRRLPEPQAKYVVAVKRVRVIGTIQGFTLRRLTWNGIRAQYYYFLHKLRGAQGNPRQAHFLLRDELRNLDAISKQAEFLNRHKIDTAEQLTDHAAGLDERIYELCAQRKLFKNERRLAANIGRKEEYDEKIRGIMEQLRPLYQDKKQCEKILVRSLEIAEKLEQLRAIQSQEVQNNEPPGRRSRTGREHGG